MGLGKIALFLVIASILKDTQGAGRTTTPLSCEPEERYVALWDYTNDGYTATTRTVTSTLGINQSKVQTAGRQQSSTQTRDTERSSGSSSHSESNVGGEASVGASFFGGKVSGGKSWGSSMQQGFSERFGSSSTSNFNWETTDTSMFTSETSTSDSYTCPPKSHCTVTQLIGRCGEFTFKMNKFIFNSTSLLKPTEKVATDLKPSLIKATIQRPSEIWILAKNLTFQTQSGIWEPLELCPPSSFVNGFRLKRTNGTGDGLTGLGLECSKQNITSNFGTVKEIQSGVGGQGTWVTPYKNRDPREPATGFVWQSWIKFKNDGNTRKMYDYRGNWKLSFKRRDPTFIRPRGSRNVQTYRVQCPEKYAVNGIMTMLDEETKSVIVHIGLKCTYYCIPEEKLETISSYRNEGSQQTSHSVQTSVGTRKETGSSTGGSNGTESHQSSEGQVLAGIQAGFSGQFGGSSSNGFNWGSTSSSTWNEEKSESFQWYCSARNYCKIKQLVGSCGDFRVATPHKVIENIPLDEPEVDS